jgi:hypothetical protein
MPDSNNKHDTLDRVHSLELVTQSMRIAFNRNHKAYTDAIGAMDGHIAVIRVVLNDMSRGDTITDAEGNIDWDKYYAQYNEFVEKQEAEQAEARSATNTPVVESLPDTEELFGGDFNGSGNRSVSQGVEDQSL